MPLHRNTLFFCVHGGWCKSVFPSLWLQGLQYLRLYALWRGEGILTSSTTHTHSDSYHSLRLPTKRGASLMTANSHSDQYLVGRNLFPFAVSSVAMMRPFLTLPEPFFLFSLNAAVSMIHMLDASAVMQCPPGPLPPPGNIIQLTRSQKHHWYKM